MSTTFLKNFQHPPYYIIFCCQWQFLKIIDRRNINIAMRFRVQFYHLIQALFTRAFWLTVKRLRLANVCYSIRSQTVCSGKESFLFKIADPKPFANGQCCNTFFAQNCLSAAAKCHADVGVIFLLHFRC